MKLRVNPIACEGHGLCAELVPELIRLDDWGFPIVADGEVPRSLQTHARRAVAACPTLALALERTAQSEERAVARKLSPRRA
jgi:ferredoxin